MGVAIGLLAWLGFAATTSGGGYLFADRPPKLYLIDFGYHLVRLTLIGDLLGSWG